MGTLLTTLILFCVVVSNRSPFVSHLERLWKCTHRTDCAAIIYATEISQKYLMLNKFIGHSPVEKGHGVHHNVISAISSIKYLCIIIAFWKPNRAALGVNCLSTSIAIVFSSTCAYGEGCMVAYDWLRFLVTLTFISRDEYTLIPILRSGPLSKYYSPNADNGMCWDLRGRWQHLYMDAIFPDSIVTFWSLDLRTSPSLDDLESAKCCADIFLSLNCLSPWNLWSPLILIITSTKFCFFLYFCLEHLYLIIAFAMSDYEKEINANNVLASNHFHASGASQLACFFNNKCCVRRFVFLT